MGVVWRLRFNSSIAGRLADTAKQGRRANHFFHKITEDRGGMKQQPDYAIRRQMDCVKAVYVFAALSVYCKCDLLRTGVFSKYYLALDSDWYMWVWISGPDNWGDICHLHMEEDGDGGSKPGSSEIMQHIEQSSAQKDKKTCVRVEAS